MQPRQYRVQTFSNCEDGEQEKIHQRVHPLRFHFQRHEHQRRDQLFRFHCVMISDGAIDWFEYVLSNSDGVFVAYNNIAFFDIACNINVCYVGCSFFSLSLAFDATLIIFAHSL